MFVSKAKYRELELDYENLDRANLNLSQRNRELNARIELLVDEIDSLRSKKPAKKSVAKKTTKKEPVKKKASK